MCLLRVVGCWWLVINLHLISKLCINDGNKVVFLQMFTEITRQVLQTKKSSQIGDGGLGNDRIKLSEKGRKGKKNKSSCC